MPKQPTKHFIRGGQIIFHNLWMLLQVSKNLLLIGLLLFVSTLGLSLFMTTTTDDRTFLSTWLKTKTIGSIKPETSVAIPLSNGQMINTTAATFLNATYTQQKLGQLTRHFKRVLILTSFGYLLLMLVTIVMLKRYGKKQSKPKHIRGDVLATPDELKKILHTRGDSPGLCLSRDKVILPKSIEPMHFLICGSTGTGKSNLIKSCLQQLRERGDKVIVYDKNADFLPHFFDEQHDTLLNPLDHRSQHWDLWQECSHTAHFDQLAAALIPRTSNYGDPFWIDAARNLFSACAQHFTDKSKDRLPALLHTLLNIPLAELAKTLRNTQAAALISADNEKTSLSIRTTLTPYLKSLQFLRSGETPFSIKQFMRSDDPGWLFMTSGGDLHESLRPLLSMWLDTVAQAILSLPPDNNRRVWLILDELASLQVLPSLKQLTSEGRKFGACVVAGIQNYAQLSDLYGVDGARSLSSLLNTRVIFHQPDPTMAQWSARNLGEKITSDTREGFSYGASHIRDGVSVQRIEQQKPLVYPADILNLDNLHAYLRLPGNLPITPLVFDYHQYDQHHQPFVTAPMPLTPAPPPTPIKPSSQQQSPLKQSASPKRSVFRY